MFAFTKKIFYRQQLDLIKNHVTNMIKSICGYYDNDIVKSWEKYYIPLNNDLIINRWTYKQKYHTNYLTIKKCLIIICLFFAILDAEINIKPTQIINMDDKIYEILNDMNKNITNEMTNDEKNQYILFLENESVVNFLESKLII